MSLWDQVLKAPDHIRQRIIDQYSGLFPIDVRNTLADVIEEKVL